MDQGFGRYRTISRIFWALSITAIVIWSLVPGYVVGWDLEVYRNALVALRSGRDPYLVGTAAQRVYHAQLAMHVAHNDPTPFCYVYSPLTLPLLRFIGRFPFLLSAIVYWVIYWAMLAAAIWVGALAVEEKERKVFALLLPVMVFFPGLLQQDVLFSGNVAYILYGAVLVAAVRGWRRGDWRWFYVATLAASCCKAPLLSLLVIPVFSARRQWLPAGVTGAAGVALFAMQPYIWPVAFKNYLEAVELQFSFNHDFSSSPAGLLANALYDRIPYTTTSAVAYLAYGALVAGILWVLSRRFLAGVFSLGQWVPVLLLGAILLNPRIMEYDVAPITVPMALVAWRVFARRGSLKTAIVGMATLFAAINIVAAVFSWRLTECLTLCGLFLVGAWDLFQIETNGVGSESVVGDAVVASV